MVFEDRVAKYPNRYILHYEDGTEQRATLERDDMPSVEGTVINAELMNKLSTVAGAINAKEAAEAAQAAAESSASAAATSEKNAASSETNAKTSETNAASSASTASTKASEAATSASNASTSEANAKASQTAAANSANEAKTSETNAKTSETNAKSSQTAAKTSETNAKASESNAKTSETNAATSAAQAERYAKETGASSIDFTGATSSTAGVHGLVPAPEAGKQESYLRGDGTWAEVQEYTLPEATSSTLGGVKVGSNITVSGGTISVTADNVRSALDVDRAELTNDITTGYTLVASFDIKGSWENYHFAALIASRHSGTGVLAFSASLMADTWSLDKSYGSITLFSTSNSFGYDSGWYLYVSNGTVYVIARVYDYDKTLLSICEKSGNITVYSEQPIYTSIQSEWGTLLATATIDTGTATAETIPLPSQSGGLTYTGSAQSPTWSNYDSSKMVIVDGTTSATNAGTYYVQFVPKVGYCWSDGTMLTKTASWIIGAGGSLTVPSQSGTLTYNTAAQSPTWSNYDSSKLTIGGTTSSTNAGTYTATFTPKTNYAWYDGTTSTKSVAWTIGKAAGEIQFTSSHSGADYWFEINSLGNGTIKITRTGGSVLYIYRNSETKDSNGNEVYIINSSNWRSYSSGQSKDWKYWYYNTQTGDSGNNGTMYVTITVEESDNYLAASTTGTLQYDGT